MSKIQVLEPGQGIDIYNRLRRLFSKRHGKDATSKCLKSGTLYIHAIDEPTAPDGLRLRMYNTDICTAYRDGRVVIRAYNSTTTRANLQDYTGLRAWSVGDGNHVLEGAVLYSGTIEIDADGYAEAGTVVRRERKKRSVLKQFQAWFKPWAQLMQADIKLREDEMGVVGYVSERAIFENLCEHSSNPTMAVAREALDLKAFDIRNYRTRGQLPDKSTYAALRASMLDQYMQANDGIERADYDVLTRKFLDGKSQGE
jgi:hypothetical protein